MKQVIATFFAAIGLFVFAIIAFIFMLFNSVSEPKITVSSNSVMYINFTDQMTEFSPNSIGALFSGSSDSLRHLVEAIDIAKYDDRIKGIVARVDHAHMGIAQAQELRNAIMRFRVAGRDSGKFTIAFSDTFGEMTPGTEQYYLASAFDEVWMQPIGSVGFTGLSMTMPFARKALDEWGIVPQIDKREDYKGLLEFLTEQDFSDANRHSLQSVLTSLMNQIVREVAVSRDLTEAEVRDAVDNCPMIPSEAKKAGLIDRIAYFDELKDSINERTKYPPSIITPYAYLQENPGKQPESGVAKVALVFGVGSIYRDGDGDIDIMGSMTMGARKTAAALSAAADDPDVAVIVFRINSGGGSPVASETIWRAVRLAQKKGKPVIVSMGDMASSGGYWIASHADKIVANPSTITGSIGVVGGKIVAGDFWKNLGVNWGSISVGKNAEMFSYTKPYSEHSWQRLQAWLDEIYQTFIDRVADGRKLPKEHIAQVAQGRVWTGEDAVKFGLVDVLGDLKSAIDVARAEIGMKDEDMAVELFPKQLSFMEKFVGNIVQAAEAPSDTIDVSTTISSVLRKVMSSLLSSTKIYPLTTPVVSG